MYIYIYIYIYICVCVCVYIYVHIYRVNPIYVSIHIAPTVQSLVSDANTPVSDVIAPSLNRWVKGALQLLSNRSK